MSQEQWTAVDQYLTNLFVPPDRALAAALESSAAAGLPFVARRYCGVWGRGT